MGVEGIKRWHWIFLGGLVGLALAYAWSSVGSSVEGYRAVDNVRFEQELTMNDSTSGQPFIKGIVIHPPEDSFDGKVNVVTYKRLAKDKAGRVGWLDKRMIAKIPYRPMIARGPISDNLTIQTYLQQVAMQNNKLRYNYGWWLEPNKAMLLGVIAGVVLIGGIWPTLLNVMLGAGFGRQIDPEEEARAKAAKGFDWGSLLRRAKGAEVAHAGAGGAIDQSGVHDVAAAYEKNLQGSGVGHTEAAIAGDANSRLVKKLEGGALEEVKPMPKPGDDDEIEVKGEYYPVLIHHKKHHEETTSSKPQPNAPDQKK